MSFTSLGFARFNWHSLAQLLAWSFSVWLSLRRRQRYTWHRNISTVYYRWPEPWHYIFCFVQSGEAFMVKGNKYTHTHTNESFSFYRSVLSQKLLLILKFPQQYNMINGIQKLMNWWICQMLLISDRVQHFCWTWGIDEH